jgi:hypothetical protein
MKTLVTIFFLSFLMSLTFAQTPQAVEADLLKSYKKIEYLYDHHNIGDDLINANSVFRNKLKYYTEKYPASIDLPFNALKKERLDIFTSTDGLFRIYSWDTWLGGTMHIFDNVLQYKVGTETKSVLLIGDVNSYVPFYDNLYTFKTGEKTYYMGIYNTIYSSKDVGTGIKVFAIENGKLNDGVKIIKTTSGLKAKLYYDYDFWSVVDIASEKRPTITFDQAKQTIHLPLVDDDGQVTKKLINYKFNGQYFEKIKS